MVKGRFTRTLTSLADLKSFVLSAVPSVDGVKVEGYTVPDAISEKEKTVDAKDIVINTQVSASVKDEGLEK